MAIIAIRTVIIYCVVLFAIRVMGKSELSKLSPFQLVITFMIAELATIPIESSSIPIMTGITAIASLVFLQVLISFLSIKSDKFKNFINGTPSILIDNGAINTKELAALRLSINDLLEQLRLANATSVTDVDYAIMEANGNLSVIQNSNASSSNLPCVLFSHGMIYDNNLKKIGYTREAFEKYLSENKLSISKIKNKNEPTYLIFCDDKKQLHIYKEDKNGFAKDITSK